MQWCCSPSEFLIEPLYVCIVAINLLWSLFDLGDNLTVDWQHGLLLFPVLVYIDDIFDFPLIRLGISTLFVHVNMASY